MRSCTSRTSILIGRIPPSSGPHQDQGQQKIKRRVRLDLYSKIYSLEKSRGLSGIGGKKNPWEVKGCRTLEVINREKNRIWGNKNGEGEFPLSAGRLEEGQLWGHSEREGKIGGGRPRVESERVQ